MKKHLIFYVIIIIITTSCKHTEDKNELSFKMSMIATTGFIPYIERDILTIYINENNDCFVNIGLEKPKKMEDDELSETYLKYILSDFTEDYKQSLLTLFLVHDSLSLYQLKKTMNKFDSLEVICENYIDNFDTTINKSKYYMKPITVVSLLDKNKIVRERRSASFPISIYLPKLTTFQKEVYFNNNIPLKFDTSFFDIDYHISINNDMNDQKSTIRNAKQTFSKQISIDTIQNNGFVNSRVGLPYPVEFNKFKMMYDTIDSNHNIKYRYKTLKYKTINHKYQLPFNLDDAIAKTNFSNLKADSVEKKRYYTNNYDYYNYLMKQHKNNTNYFDIYKIANSIEDYKSIGDSSLKYFIFDSKYFYVSKEIKYSDLFYFVTSFNRIMGIHIRFYD